MNVFLLVSKHLSPNDTINISSTCKKYNEYYYELLEKSSVDVNILVLQEGVYGSEVLMTTHYYILGIGRVSIVLDNLTSVSKYFKNIEFSSVSKAINCLYSDVDFYDCVFTTQLNFSCSQSLFVFCFFETFINCKYCDNMFENCVFSNRSNINSSNCISKIFDSKFLGCYEPIIFNDSFNVSIRNTKFLSCSGTTCYFSNLDKFGSLEIDDCLFDNETRTLIVIPKDFTNHDICSNTIVH